MDLTLSSLLVTPETLEISPGLGERDPMMGRRIFEQVLASLHQTGRAIMVPDLPVNKLNSFRARRHSRKGRVKQWTLTVKRI
jgi:hypothetical protein